MGSGQPRVPSMTGAMRMMQGQAELFSELPSIIAELQNSVRGLSETLSDSKETAASAQRVTARLEEILDQIEEPVRALRPGIERLAVVLDSPVVERLPATLETIERTVLPLASRINAATVWLDTTAARWRGRIARLRRPGGGR
jgi:chromosome segregation ATPase